ncbi:MAG: LacI family DNA-binding transcriptional regulator [Bacteroidales bacterium]|nr:LacI family DNA-binding transcriptional regulator [Bacteroidales bacterium]
MKESTPTIYDVAREAGVSRATVDRVIYKRSGVSTATVEKVRRIIKELGYTANPNASRLASKKKMTFACLIPKFEEGEYWAVAYQGFLDGARSIKAYDVDVDIHLFDPDNVESFRSESRAILSARPAGVITNVVFAEAVRDFAAELDADGIPYAFVDQKIDGLDYTVYYGADPRDAGYLGAYLLTHRLKVEELAMIRLIRDPGQKADPNRVRREGFLSYITTHFPSCKIHTVFIHPNRPEETLRTLEDFFAEHPGVRFITMANSRIHLISTYLRLHPDPGRHVVGFDDLAKNIEALREGLVEYLVTRNIPMQSHYTITRFAEAVISGKRPAKRDNFMHMDILHRLNCRDYAPEEE